MQIRGKIIYHTSKKATQSVLLVLSAIVPKGFAEGDCNDLAPGVYALWNGGGHTTTNHKYGDGLIICFHGGSDLNAKVQITVNTNGEHIAMRTYYSSWHNWTVIL